MIATCSPCLLHAASACYMQPLLATRSPMQPLLATCIPCSCSLCLLRAAPACYTQPHAVPALRLYFLLCRMDVEEVLENLRIRNTEGIKENFNSVQWTTAAMNDLETSVRGENILHFCISHLQVILISIRFDPDS